MGVCDTPLRNCINKFSVLFLSVSHLIRSKFIGMRVIDICKETIDTLKLNTDIESFYNKRIQLFLDIVKDELEALPGLIESLKLFQSNNFKIALASSGAKKYIDLVLDKFNLRDYFDVIVSGDCVKIGKPNPETYLVASKKLNFKPEECVVLEDAKNGIESAINAGCKCIAIINTNTPPQDRSKANMILDSLKEITLEKINSL
ncbi:MAG: HAD-IA family hydrolase [bacterium]